MYRVQATASLLLCSFVALVLLALWLASCPACVLVLPFPTEFMPGTRLARDNDYMLYEYNYDYIYGAYYVGEWSQWRIYFGTQARVITYTGYVCLIKDCGVYLGDVVQAYGAPVTMYHAWKTCVYEFSGAWVTTMGYLKRGEFGCWQMERPIRSISFRE